MYISKLSIINYRNFANANFSLKKGVNTLIGENGSGKTNALRAIRLLLDENMIRSAFRLGEDDFNRSLPIWQGHWIIIAIEFEEISKDEAIQALFMHGTGNIGDNPIHKATYNLIFRPKADVRMKLHEIANDQGKDALNEYRKSLLPSDYETIFTGKSSADFNDPATYQKIVGNLEEGSANGDIEIPEIGIKIPHVLTVYREVGFTFIQALRDVVAEFQNNRTNPLLTLLKAKSGEIDPASMSKILSQVTTLNGSIESLPDVIGVRSDISTTLTDTAGKTYSPSSLSIRSDLPNEADKLFQSLKLFVGEAGDAHEGTINELSLGGANLIYLTLKLLEFKYQKTKSPVANFLLIEEPESHIHTHIQKTLFDKINYIDTQIIYTTHSTHISEVSNVENVNILGRKTQTCEVYQPSNGLSNPEITTIQRYLDAVRSNLLFAKSVILVEGDAEEILIPQLVKSVFGISLDEIGISLINIRSTGFTNVAILFNDQRIKKKCSIITDRDKSFIDTTPAPADTDSLRKFKEHCIASEQAGASRESRLSAFSAGNAWIKPFYAEYTFEVDLLNEGTGRELIAAVRDVYSQESTILEAQAELAGADFSVAAKRVLSMAKYEGKGWFAILLSKYITPDSIIPNYILDAIFFAHGNFSAATWCSVLRYRLRHIAHNNLIPIEQLAIVSSAIDGFEAEEISFGELREVFMTYCQFDEAVHLMEGI